MNYTLRIKRGSEDFFEDLVDPITKQQWHTVIDKNPDFEFDIGLERSDHEYAELQNDEDDSWLHYEDNGTLTANNPTPLFIFHMLMLAAELNAIVIGEESEVYELFDQGFRSRLAYTNGDRFHRWVRIKTEQGFDFQSENSC